LPLAVPLLLQLVAASAALHQQHITKIFVTKTKKHNKNQL
jgi:hypothetical protein